MNQITKNFARSEYTRSRSASALNISNQPTNEHALNIDAHARAIMQPLRDAIGAPVVINSGYRSQALNDVTPGASKTSQHMRGEAADIECSALSNLALAQLIVDLKLPFDQLILEFHNKQDKASGWVHVSHRRDGQNRGEILSSRHGDDGPIFERGLIAAES
jgi:hypothetical protein